MSSCNGQRRLRGTVVARGKKMSDPRNRAHAIDMQNSAVTGAEHFRLIIAKHGPETEQKRGRWRTDLFDGANRLRPNCFVLIRKQLEQMRKQIVLTETAALHERQCTGSAQSSGSIGLAPPHWLHLDVTHPPEKDVYFLIFQSSERMAQRVLSPTLRIRLHRILEEAIKCLLQISRQIRSLKFAHQIGRLCHNKIIAVSKRLAQRFAAKVLGPFAECV
jgi:hypothetical protein